MYCVALLNLVFASWFNSPNELANAIFTDRKSIARQFHLPINTYELGGVCLKFAE